MGKVTGKAIRSEVDVAGRGRMTPRQGTCSGQRGALKVNGAMSWIGVKKVTKESFEGMSELHGFRFGVVIGVGVDAAEGIIDDNTRATFALGNTANRGNAEIRKVAHDFIAEDKPISLTDHVSHIVEYQVGEFESARMAALGDGMVAALKGPFGVMEQDRDAGRSEFIQTGSGGMWEE
ncbi:hypothetical protein ACA910_013737 [Epithemia clementina (nom. ined.)]